MPLTGSSLSVQQHIGSVTYRPSSVQQHAGSTTHRTRSPLSTQQHPGHINPSLSPPSSIQAVSHTNPLSTQQHPGYINPRLSLPSSIQAVSHTNPLSTQQHPGCATHQPSLSQQHPGSVRPGSSTGGVHQQFLVGVGQQWCLHRSSSTKVSEKVAHEIVYINSQYNNANTCSGDKESCALFRKH